MLVGLVTGLIAGMLGLGGGFLLIPYLNLLLGYSMHKAVGTSLLVTFFTAISATLTYFQQKMIDLRVGLTIGFAAAFGSFFGAYLTQFVSSNVLRIFFGCLAFYASLNMIISKEKFKKKHGWDVKFFPLKLSWKRILTDKDGKKFEYFADPFLLCFGSFFVGLIAGMLGIGGGSLEVPFLNMLVGIPIHISIATTFLMIVFSSGSGSIEHFMLENIVFPLIIFLCIGVLVGGHLGARISSKIPAKILRKIFGFVVLTIALRMILSFLF